jgi:hypothetical protein
VSPAIGAEAEAAREVPVADGITATIRAPGLRFSYLSSPLERRRGRGQDCSSAHPEACTAAARRSGARVVVAVIRTGGGEPPVGLSVAPQAFPLGGGLFVPAEGEPEFRL